MSIARATEIFKIQRTLRSDNFSDFAHTLSKNWTNLLKACGNFVFCLEREACVNAVAGLDVDRGEVDYLRGCFTNCRRK